MNININTNSIQALTTAQISALSVDGFPGSYDLSTLARLEPKQQRMEPFVPPYGSYLPQQGYDLHAMSFSKALAALKHGHAVRRTEWQLLKEWIRIENGKIAICSYHHVFNKVYIPSQEDILAMDWQLLITG